MRNRPFSSVMTIFAYFVGRSSVSAMTQTPACGFAGPRRATPFTMPLMLLAESFALGVAGAVFFRVAAAAPSAASVREVRRRRRIVVLFIVRRSFQNIRLNQ